MSDQAASSTPRKLPSGSFDETPLPMARAVSSSTSPKARVSYSGRRVGCTSERTPGRVAASPQDSSAVWSGRIRSARSLVSSGSEAKDTT